MRNSFFSIILSCLALLACTDAPQGEKSQADAPINEKTLPPAVADQTDPAQMTSLKEVDPPTPDMKLRLTLPEGVNAKPGETEGEYVLENEEGSFRMIMTPGERNADELRDYWQSNPESFEFKNFLIDRPEGVLVEVVRDGKLDYQVDYTLAKDGQSYILRSDLSRPYSRSQAELMYHTCRSIMALNR